MVIILVNLDFDYFHNKVIEVTIGLFIQLDFFGSKRSPEKVLHQQDSSGFIPVSIRLDYCGLLKNLHQNYFTDIR